MLACREAVFTPCAKMGCIDDLRRETPMNRSLPWSLALLMALSGAAIAQSFEDWDIMADTWVATDAIGRERCV